MGSISQGWVRPSERLQQPHSHMNAGCELFAPYYVPAGGPIASESMLNPAHIPTKTSAERLARPRCDNAPGNPVDEPAWPPSPLFSVRAAYTRRLQTRRRILCYSPDLTSPESPVVRIH